MNRPVVRVFKLLRALVWAALILGGAWGCWLYFHSRQAGREMVEMLDATWPPGTSAPLGTRERLLAAAAGLRAGDFDDVTAALAAAAALSAEEQAAAQRFLARNPDARRRFMAAAAAAQEAEAAGADTRGIRAALAGALAAAARRNATVVAVNLEIAAAGLRTDGLAPLATAAPMDRESVARMLAAFAPGFELARGLMTEGYTAAEGLLARASRQFQAGRFSEARLLISWAGELLALQPQAMSAEPAAERAAAAGAQPAPAVPDWFTELAGRPAPSVSAAQAKAAVELCTAMAAAEAVSAPLKRLVERARREAAAAELDEAYWWATVALAALGMSTQEIAAVGSEGTESL